MRTPPTLTDDEIINVSAGVGGRYAADRPWLEREDTVQQAVLEGFIAYKTYDQAKKGDLPIEPWLGWMVKNRLHDWSRRQHLRYTNKRKRESSYRVLFVEYEEVYAKGREDMGYWFVEELDALTQILTSQEKKGKMDKDETWFNALSPRQAEVLQLCADGYTIVETGAKLHISPETVKSTLKTVRHRMRAANTTHAVANALRRELIV